MDKKHPKLSILEDSLDSIGSDRLYWLFHVNCLICHVHQCLCSLLREVWIWTHLTCTAHLSKFPCDGTVQPRSFSSSLNMLFKLEGFFIPSGTEKDNPIAWPGPWYGSWKVGILQHEHWETIVDMCFVPYKWHTAYSETNTITFNPCDLRQQMQKTVNSQIRLQDETTGCSIANAE